MNELKSFVQEVILEDRYKQETGKKYDYIEQLRQYVTPSDEMPKYFFTNTDIEKVGINPRIYWCPMGVYAYPMDEEHFHAMSTSVMGFAMGKRYISVLEVAKSADLWVLDDKSFAVFCDKLRTINEKMAEEISPPVPDLPTMFFRIEDFYMHLYQHHLAYEKKNKLVTNVMRSLCDVVYSPNFNLHFDIKKEICFLTPDSYRVINTFDKTLFNPVLKKRRLNSAIKAFRNVR